MSEPASALNARVACSGSPSHWKTLQHASQRDARRFVPQYRERIFIAGFRDPNDFTLEDIDLPDPDDGLRLDAVLHPEDGSEEPVAAYTDARGRVLPSYTLSDHLWTYLKNYAEKHRRKGNGFGFGLFGPGYVARTLSARYYRTTPKS